MLYANTRKIERKKGLGTKKKREKHNQTKNIKAIINLLHAFANSLNRHAQCAILSIEEVRNWQSLQIDCLYVVFFYLFCFA